MVDFLKFLYGDNAQKRVFFPPESVDDVITQYKNLNADSCNTIGEKMELLFGVEWFEEYAHPKDDSINVLTYDYWKKLTSLTENDVISLIKTCISAFITSEPVNKTSNDNNQEKEPNNDGNDETINALIHDFNEYLDSDKCKEDLKNHMTKPPVEKRCISSKDTNNTEPTVDYSKENITTTEDHSLKNYEMVNHPSHYNSSRIETIEKMIRIYGKEKVAWWCEITAFKYRDRIGNKPNNSLEQEMGKIKWYENKANELFNELNNNQE